MKQRIAPGSGNPDVLDPMEAYLHLYPDPELQPIADALRAEQQKNVASADEQRGYQALKHKDTGAAAVEFNSVLRQSPNDVNAIAGLGFVRLDQKQFAEALSLFEKARSRYTTQQKSPPANLDIQLA
ncbi:MAG TPA: tetratricopeptide repeat protein [Terracidiphilus sp.]|nr:tetratricopeptide repeat protein [Terracidiphilus sp.]